MNKEKLPAENNSVSRGIEIADVYVGIPRCGSFILWCNNRGKQFMHELSDEDFESAKKIKGLGLSSVENLRTIHKSFLISEQSEGIGCGGQSVSTKISANTPVETIFQKLPHGKAFCDHCRFQGISVLSDLRDFSFNHGEIKGIGSHSMLQMKQIYMNAVMQMDAPPLEPCEFVDIPSLNYGISIPLEILTDENYKCIGDICQKGLSFSLFIEIKDWISTYKTSIVDIFIKELTDLRENNRYCLTMRARGQTLQQIANLVGVTRERVRQIVTKTTKKLIPNISALTEAILYPNREFFTFDDLLQVFPDPLYAEIYRFIVKNTDELNHIVYLDFAEKFLKGTLNEREYEAMLLQVAEEGVGDGLNFFDNLEQIDALLKEKNIPALDFEDFMNFLVKNKYHFYGDYVMRGHQSYAIVCADAVRKFFPQGMKLNTDENNVDIKYLRRIIAKHYGNFELPENNRALLSRMTTVLIQSGRSQYCHIDSVVYNMRLFDKIYEYIQNTSQPSFHYSELFELFKERLLTETNITNYHFLHGMLKYLYFEDFVFDDRDIITKQGEIKRNADFRLNELLVKSGQALSKKEIKSVFPGIRDFVIAFSVSREEHIIQWDYNMYNHIGNLDASDEDISRLASIIERKTKKNNGYLSGYLLFEAVKMEFPQFLIKNKMKNERNLYYAISYFFRDAYRFRRPHILSTDIDMEELSLMNIAKYLLDFKSGLNYKEYMDLASRVGWANGTIYSIFSELEKEFIRISEDDYVPKNMFVFERVFVEKFKEIITSLLKENGYLAMFAPFSFQEYPPCIFEWNVFLVKSIIEEFETGFKILSPQIKDRRYLRGIIVGADHSAHSFEELVVHVMKANGNILFSELEFCEYLKQKGLIFNTIPQELYNCSDITFENEVFSIAKTR